MNSDSPQHKRTTADVNLSNIPQPQPQPQENGKTRVQKKGMVLLIYINNRDR